MFRQDVFFLLTALGAGVRFAELFVFLFSIAVYVMSIVSIIQEYYYIGTGYEQVAKRILKIWLTVYLHKYFFSNY